MAACIILLHVITGFDHNSRFYGNNIVLNHIESCKEAPDLLVSCGTELQTSTEVLDDLDKFVMRVSFCSVSCVLWYGENNSSWSESSVMKSSEEEK